MSDTVIIRVGGRILVGTIISSTGTNNRVTLRYEVTAGKMKKMIPEEVSVDSRFFFGKVVEGQILATPPPSSKMKFRDMIHEEVVSLISSGRGGLSFGKSRIVAYERTGRGIGFLSENSVSWSSQDGVLLQCPEFGEYLALEALRSRVSSCGLFDGIGEVMNSCTMIRKPFRVYMKKDPFRDITQINEGTQVLVVGYHQGCLTLEADGEEFWIPIEERYALQPDFKESDYYFSLDADHDNVPDPLVFLPSKAALGSYVAGPDENWNIQPDLHSVAGHFSSVDEIRNDEFSILPESYAKLEFYNDWQHHRPDLHGLGSAPGLQPTDPMQSFLKQDAVRMDMTAQDFSNTGVDATPHNYDGETGSSAIIEQIVDALLAGADPDEVLGEGLSWDDLEPSYVEEFNKVFPELSPDLDTLKRIHLNM